MQINPYKPELGRAGAGEILARFLGNAERYIAREIPNGIFNIHAEKIEPAGWLIGIAIAPVIIYGLFRLGNHRGLIAGYLAGTLEILLLWPESWFGIRFLLPIVPLLLFCLLNGLYQLLCLAVSKTAIKRRPSPLFLILLVFLLFPHLKHVHALAEFGRYPESWQNYLEIARWVNENTAGDSVVCCRKPFMFYLYANRYVTTYKNTLDDKELIADLREKEVDYIVIDNLGYTTTHRYLIPAIEKNPEEFTLVHSLKNPDTWLLKF